MSRSWKPIRRGARYCSPACGYGCTHAAYMEARKRAKHLLSIMKTSGWEIDVWENLGWHYALRHKKLEISLHVSGVPHEFFMCGPSSLVQHIGHMKDPNALVFALMKHIRAQSTFLHDALLELSK